MSIRFPSKLIPGDLIAITAPSSGVPQHLHPRLELAIKNLQREGFRVREGDCLRSQHKNKSADNVSRAKELMRYLTDPEVKAVMPPWGGDLAMELLELVDFSLLAQTKPKWFVGFSDLSTFHFPLLTLSGWATLHGPNLMDLGAKELDTTTKAIWDVLKSERGTEITQYASTAFQPDENQWGTATDVGFNLTQQTKWKHLDGVTSSASFQGRLIGGCLDIISRLAGTPFGNLPLFQTQNSDDGVILYFENVEMGPCELTRALFSLRLHGWFNKVNGILIGRSAGPNVSVPTQHNYLDALRSALGDLAVPVLYDVDIGHIPPQLSLVNGARAIVLFTQDSGSITQQL
ncbi:LD-carboxypeptidase [Pectobacterium polonicum]|uniref:LD-carboxypeptidase n=1 Tax=Pectobacterium polonicum TaxID=2485124 RepID=A0AAE9NT20_9GAMM|nr:S66 peptidase family protein [Pectobacterium polonicum]UVO08086.1 LD-carboxypeptidase [Pectobacterium polonicum]GKW25720.1 LD-carboxypeptidase [Pectobacterium carotovorum subsp. carotovorum]